MVKRSSVLHDAYHDVFCNRTGWEVITKLQEWANGQGLISPEFLKRKHHAFRDGFHKIFGDERRVKVLIEIIKRDWIPPGVRISFDYDEMRRAMRQRKELLGFLPKDPQ